MSYAFTQLQLALAADGGHASVRMHPSKPQRRINRTRDFAELAARSVYEHARTTPEVRAKIDKLTASDLPLEARVRSALPAVTQVARSLYTLAASQDIPFSDIFTKSTIAAVAQQLVAV